MLERVIDFVTDRDMQASSEVRIVMLDYLKAFQKHLDSGYVPSKDVQLLQDKLETTIKEFEESLMSEPEFNIEEEKDKIVEEVEENEDETVVAFDDEDNDDFDDDEDEDNVDFGDDNDDELIDDVEDEDDVSADPILVEPPDDDKDT